MPTSFEYTFDEVNDAFIEIRDRGIARNAHRLFQEAGFFPSVEVHLNDFHLVQSQAFRDAGIVSYVRARRMTDKGPRLLAGAEIHGMYSEGVLLMSHDITIVQNERLHFSLTYKTHLVDGILNPIYRFTFAMTRNAGDRVIESFSLNQQARDIYHTSVHTAVEVHNEALSKQNKYIGFQTESKFTESAWWPKFGLTIDAANILNEGRVRGMFSQWPMMSFEGWDSLTPDQAARELSTRIIASLSKGV